MPNRQGSFPDYVTWSVSKVGSSMKELWRERGPVPVRESRGLCVAARGSERMEYALDKNVATVIR
jgi:hypothetical protein